VSFIHRLTGLPEKKQLVSFDEFETTLIDVNEEYALHKGTDTYLTLSCVKGECVLINGDQEIKLNYTESVFVPAAVSEIAVKGSCRLLAGLPHVNH